MIKYIKGNLLNSEAEALVNTVNTVGVMGKGIALQFKNRFKQNYKIYKEACDKGTFDTGQVLVVKENDLSRSRTIINFPTKKHWRGNSKYEYISSGLKALKKSLTEHNIASVAIPPLGCGNGGLDWDKVRNLIESELTDLAIDIYVYEPNDQIKATLQKEVKSKEVKLTPARAMMIYLLFLYESRGEQSSLFVANKLAYFLQRSGENLKLKFEPSHYGPYSVQINHVLLYLNGVYLKGMEQNEVKPFESLNLNYDKLEEIRSYINQNLKSEQIDRLKRVSKLITGFESTFSLELLASVDFISKSEESKNLDLIKSRLWSNRKKELFKEKYLKIALDRLNSHSTILNIS
jgi:O-acetyl-ADP-ribose deacetylase (regulator of RNase III)